MEIADKGQGTSLPFLNKMAVVSLAIEGVMVNLLRISSLAVCHQIVVFGSGVQNGASGIMGSLLVSLTSKG